MWNKRRPGHARRGAVLATLAALVTGLAAAGSVRADHAIFENDLVRLEIGSDGFAKSLTEKSTGANWLADQPMCFAWIRKAGRIYPATAIQYDGAVLRMTFADSGVVAECRISARPRYFVIELASLNDDAVEEVCLGQLRSRIRENHGGWLDVQWNDRFAVCFMGLSDRVNTGGGRAIVYRAFGMVGQKAALIATPTENLMHIVQIVEKDCGLPSPTIGGVWAKQSPDVRRGYLFTDLTEANVDQTIRYARLGGFAYVMTYSGTWSTSLGSYPINTKNFPDGEASLKRTIDKCHAAGLKVGMHMLTSFVHKHDALVRPTPDPRLLKDAEAVLSADIDAGAREIPAASLEGFPAEAGFYGDARQGFDVVIDDEIIHYGGLGPAESPGLVRCTRGYAGTKAAPHMAGAKIQHLAQRYGCYLVDLRTSLKDELADRIAGLINRCGFDMIYFDGGECNSANGPAWYWVGQQQMSIYQRVKRDLLVQGSGGTPWTWHIFNRGCCDDFAAVAPKQYLDHHKIADSWRHYTRSFMPAELGWWGFLDDTPDHPATSPDEVELYAVRMLALDSPVSLETSLAALKSNGRTDELLELLGRYETIRLGGRVSPEVRGKLRQGEWHMMQIDGKPAVAPVNYDVQHIPASGPTKRVNPFAAQPLKFRLRAEPALAPVGDEKNITLLRSDPGTVIQPPAADAPMPGALAGRVEFDRPEGEPVSPFLVGASTDTLKGKLNLLRHRALAIHLKVDRPATAKDEPVAVLNVQLEGPARTFRDHYIDLDFTGEKTIILPEPTPQRMLAEFRPAPANYAFKAAGYHFNYAQIVALNFRWMRQPKQSPVTCDISRVEALAESDTTIKNPVIAIGDAKLALPVDLAAGDFAEYWADGPVRVFNRHGVLLSQFDLPTAPPQLVPGENDIHVTHLAPGRVKLNLITLGEPMPLQ